MGSERSSLFANLTPEQLLQLQKRLMRQRLRTPRSVIQQRPTLSPCPLSFAQQRLWFLHQLAPHSSFYNVARAFRLCGPLSIVVLQRALDAIVARHEVLRTTFSAVDGCPVQVITENRVADLKVVDLCMLPATEREAEAQLLLYREVQRPFDLTRDVMLRVMVLRLSPEDSILLVVMQHIASDLWSADIFFRELSTLYIAFLHGQKSPLPALPIQYADFAMWQRQWLQGEVLTQQLAYWEAQLARVPAVLDLPTDHPRPAVQSWRGAQETCHFPKALRATLHAMSRAEDSILFMTLVAAWKALLYRYAGQTHVVIGTPITHRRRVELEGLIGFFVNTLVLHTHLNGSMSFRELLARVRQVTLEAFDHSDLPFEKLVEELQATRTLHYHPLFQAMFNFRSAPEEVPDFPNHTVECLSLESNAEQLDLTLSITDSADGLQGTLTYNADLFEAPTVSRMLGHYRTLLDAVSASPDLPIAALPLLPPAEQHALLVTWNQTQRDYPRERCLHQLFEAQTARRPEAVTVVCNGHFLTYRQLNQQANQLAHFLRTLGVGAEVFVGICVERSLAMLVGLLGILKAGGGYVPLDPAYPPERLAFMLADTQTPFVLTQTHLVDRLPLISAKVICVDGDWDSINQQNNTNPVSLTTADNLAYVTYTSGSTGQPKGVCIPHRGVMRLVMHINYVTLTASDIILQFASLAFDASTFEIWGGLLHGARLVVTPPQGLSVEELGQLVQDSQVTILWLTANLFQHMVDRQRASLRQLRQLQPVPVGVPGELYTGGDGLARGYFNRSLLATRIMARVHNAFQIDLPLRTLFEAPTVAAFAATVMQHHVLHVEDDALQGLMADVEGLSETEMQRLLSAKEGSDDQ